jgi:hypothetical protein
MSTPAVIEVQRTTSGPRAADRKAAPVAPGAHRSKQGVFCVWHGLNAAAFRRLCGLRPPTSRRFRGRWLSLAAVSRLNSFHEWWERRLYGGRLERTRVTHPPLFVLGHWRSGTTLLHELLTLDPQFTFPNMYQVLFPGHFLVTEGWLAPLTGWAVPRTRPMDNMTAHWRMPQEDEVALLLRTLISPYMMLAFQGQRARYERYFDLTELTAEERALWIEEFLAFLKRLTIRADKPIVLKSPSHTYRIPLLLELFPQARFIYIYRNPYDVYSSSLHLRRTMFTENALAEPNFEGLEEDMFLTYERCIDRYESTKGLIPPGQLCEVRFEDLEADPVGQMRRVYQELHLSGWDAAESAICRWLPAHIQYRKNRFALDAGTMQRVYHRWRRSFELYGYDSGLTGLQPPNG